MKKTPTFYIKTVLVIIGFLLLLVSGTMSITEEVYYSNYRVYSEFLPSNRRRIDQTIGFINPLWYCIVSTSLIIFAIGYFFNRTVNIVLVFVFAPLFGIGILIATALATFSLSFGGSASRTELGAGYPIADIAYILIVVATCISVLKKKPKRSDSLDLLDN